MFYGKVHRRAEGRSFGDQQEWGRGGHRQVMGWTQAQDSGFYVEKGCKEESYFVFVLKINNNNSKESVIPASHSAGGGGKVVWTLEFKTSLDNHIAILSLKKKGEGKSHPKFFVTGSLPNSLKRYHLTECFWFGILHNNGSGKQCPSSHRKKTDWPSVYKSPAHLECHPKIICHFSKRIILSRRQWRLNRFWKSSLSSSQCAMQGHNFSIEEVALHSTPPGGEEQLFYHQR